MTRAERQKLAIVHADHLADATWPNYWAWSDDIVRQAMDRRGKYGRAFIPGILRRGKKVDRVKPRPLPAGQLHRLWFPL
jgi:hypothetical protein